MNVLITGANRGIGLELVRLYQQQGQNVYAICRNSSDELKRSEAEIFSGVDLKNESALRAVVPKLTQKLNGTPIDILINNAGILRAQTFANINFDDAREQFEVNSIAPIRTTKVLSHLLASASKVVMITSRMGSIADNTSGGQYGYRMSKAALNIAAVSLAHDLKSLGITVGIVHPGYVRTEMTGKSGNISPEESAKQIAQRIKELDLRTSGTFVHANGERLPW